MTESTYQPGDIANGHILGPDGQWRPLPPAATQKSSNTLLKVLLVVGVAILLLFAGCAVMIGNAVNESAQELGSTAEEPYDPDAIGQGFGSQDASGDVVMGAPTLDEYGDLVVPVTITNNSEKRSNYWIDVVAESADGKLLYGTDSVLVNDLAPGQTANEEFDFFEDVPADAVVKITEISRTAS